MPAALSKKEAVAARGQQTSLMKFFGQSTTHKKSNHKAQHGKPDKLVKSGKPDKLVKSDKPDQAEERQREVSKADDSKKLEKSCDLHSIRHATQQSTPQAAPAATPETQTSKTAPRATKRELDSSDSEQEFDLVNNVTKSAEEDDLVNTEDEADDTENHENNKDDESYLEGDNESNHEGENESNHEDDNESNQDHELEEDFFSPKKKKHKPNNQSTAIITKRQTNNKGNHHKTQMKTYKTDSQLMNNKDNNNKENGDDDDDNDDDVWRQCQSTPYAALCRAFAKIESISSRLEIQQILTNLFRQVLIRDGGGDQTNINQNIKSNHINSNIKPNTKSNKNSSKKSNQEKSTTQDLYHLLYLSSNTVAPAYDCVELGVGDGILLKAIGEACGTSPAMMKQKYQLDGDLGTVAQTCKGKQRTLGFGRPKPLSVGDVLQVFRQIATTSGSQSQKWKVDKIKGLLVRARNSEAKYLIRGLQGKLRIGLAQSTVLASLAHAILLTKPKHVTLLTNSQLKDICKLDNTKDAYPDYARKLCTPNLPLETKLELSVNIVKKAYSEVPSFDSLLDALLRTPLPQLHLACTLTPGIPVEPMLAKPTKSVLEVLKRLNGLRFTCEYKYDGERAQVHMTPDGTTKVFSRSLLNTSEKFPEVPLYVRQASHSSVQSFVLDTEVVAFHRETNQFVPFQVLSTRKRTEESAETAKVQVIVQAFDLMYLNGRSLLDRPLSERRDLMKKHFVPVQGKFQFATSLDHTENGDTAIIEEFLDNAIKGQCEGLMVKTLDDHAAYEPSRRSLNWLKLKKDYLEGLGDSVDLVPLGAYHGRGKRTGVYGAYLLACYDENTEEFQSVCKIGTGFSEEDLKSLAESLGPHIIPQKSTQYLVSDSLHCDVWFDAVQVWEIKAADLSKSSTHKGAIDKTGEAGRGIGLRFPRFERIRPDKSPEDATTSDQILEMYYAQESVVGGDDQEGI